MFPVACEEGRTNVKVNSSFLHENDTSVNSTFSLAHEQFIVPELYVILAFGAASLSTLIGLFNIVQHFKNYTHPEFQRSLVRILFIVPIYAIFSWLSLAVPSQSLIFESIRDCWEALVIWEFLKLILAYCGGESACLTVIAKNPGSVRHMWPLNYCFRPLRLDPRFMRICKRFTLQFVLIKPVMAIVNIIMLELCMYTNKAYQVSQLIVYNISYSLSLYGLVLFYIATHHHPGLKSRKPLLKFAAIKTIIFATYYQGMLVQLVPGYDRNYLEALNNFIFCWEMIIFSLLHVWAFGWFEYVGGGPGIGDFEEGNGGGLDMNPIGMASIALSHQDHEIDIKKSSDLQDNIKHALNIGDVLSDTAVNFNITYNEHARLDTTGHNTSGCALIDGDDDDEKDAQNPFSQLCTSTLEADYPLRTSAVVNRQPALTQNQSQQSNPFTADLFMED